MVYLGSFHRLKIMVFPTTMEKFSRSQNTYLTLNTIKFAFFRKMYVQLQLQAKSSQMLAFSQEIMIRSEFCMNLYCHKLCTGAITFSKAKLKIKSSELFTPQFRLFSNEKGLGLPVMHPITHIQTFPSMHTIMIAHFHP